MPGSNRAGDPPRFGDRIHARETSDAFTGARLRVPETKRFVMQKECRLQLLWGAAEIGDELGLSRESAFPDAIARKGAGNHGPKT